MVIPAVGSVYFASIYHVYVSDVVSSEVKAEGLLTEPLVGPSCAEAPLTLKATPLGAFDLTSILAVQEVSNVQLGEITTRTGSGVVEVLVE